MSENRANAAAIDQAEDARKAYLRLGPTPMIGTVGLGVLSEWCAATEDVTLPPDHTYDVAWMNIEGAFAANDAFSQAATDFAPQAGQYIKQAETCLNQAIRGAGRDKTYEYKARLTKAALPFLRFGIADPSVNVNTLLTDYAHTTNLLSTDMYKWYARTREPQALPLLQAATLITLFNEDDLFAPEFGGFKALGVLGGTTLGGPFEGLPASPSKAPLKNTARNLKVFLAPSRCAFGADELYDQWQTQVWHFDKRDIRIYPLRIAPEGVSSQTVLPPSLFKNNEFPSPSGQGFLEAFLRQLAGKDKDPATARKINGIKRSIVNNLMSQFTPERSGKNVPEGRDMSPEDIAKWYRSLSPRHRITAGDADRLEAIAGEQASRYWSRELSFEDTEALAWLYVEGAQALAAGDDVHTAGIQFDNAAEIFKHAQESNLPQTTTEVYRLAWAEASIPVYKAIVTAGEIPEEIMQTYTEALAELADEVLREHDGLLAEGGTAEAASLYKLLRPMTTALALNTLTYGGFVCVPSSLRQQGGGAKEGWDTTAWPVLSDGNVRNSYFAKLRQAEKADPTLLDEGIATIGEQVFNYAGQHYFKRTARQTLRVLWGERLTDSQQADLDATVATLVEAVQSGELG